MNSRRAYAQGISSAFLVKLIAAAKRFLKSLPFSRLWHPCNANLTVRLNKNAEKKRTGADLLALNFLLPRALGP